MNLDNTTIDLVEHAKLSFTKALESCSNIDKDVLRIDGMSGVKHRHFINNLCSIDSVNYLEVGLFTGSTFCSAISNNLGTFTGIDNWSEFNKNLNNKKIFYEHLRTFQGSTHPKIIDKDCWKVKLFDKYNVFNYDGDHSEISHFNALNHYIHCMDKKFIYIVDDWNWPAVREPTIKSIEKNNLNILYFYEIKTTDNDSHPPSENARQRSDWHNGIAFYILSQ